jgi:hypothetical protein
VISWADILAGAALWLICAGLPFACVALHLRGRSE